MSEDKPTPEFVNYIEEDKLVKDSIAKLLEGAYNNTLSYRKKIKQLKKAYMAAFTKDLTLTAETFDTNFLPAPLSRIQCEVAMRLIRPPLFNIQSYNRSYKSLDDRNKENVIKSLLEVVLRMMGFEQVFREGKETWIPYGDTYRRPFKRKHWKKKGVFIPALEDLNGVDLMLDPACRYIKSENKAKEAQFYAHTQIYTKSALVARFGKWILEYAQEGTHIDSARLPSALSETEDSPDGIRSYVETQAATNEKYYEVLEYQNKAEMIELVLVGANAFPQTRIVESSEYDNPQPPHEECIWSSAYPHINTLGEPVIHLYNNHLYHDPDSPYNRGIVEKVFAIQVAHHILENLKFDTFRKKNDPIPFIAGGRKDLMQQQTRAYRKEKLRDRDAFLHLPSSMTGNVPTTGLIQFEGYNPQEVEQATQDMYDLAKNTVGVNPQRQEIQKNTGVGQSDIVEEEKVDAMQELVEGNITNYISEYRGILDYCIANKGFGLKKTMINFTKYTEEKTPDEKGTVVVTNPNATVSFVEACEIASGHEFDIIIERSSLVKKSRFIENEKLTTMLGSLPANTAQGAVKKIGKEIGKNLGLDLLDEDFGDLSQASASGGASQFKSQPQVGDGQDPAQADIALEEQIPSL